MIRTFAETSFKWLDILAPTPEELREIATQYGIHEAFIQDVLQPEHLPKYEPVGNTSFYILRYYAESETTELDTIQGLTNKIAIFQTDDLVVTIHRRETDLIENLKKDLIDSGKCKGVFHLLNRLIKAVFLSYERPASEFNRKIDALESNTFLNKDRQPILKDLYIVKRQIEACRVVLIHSKDILERVDDPEHQDPNTRDTRDLYIRVLTLFNTMSENANHLMTLYFSISAQRTNEVVRVLTIFSVFFMPLTFIVGIYGMNFEFMPELGWKVGYPSVMIFMAIVTFTIFLWFRRKNWL